MKFCQPASHFFFMSYAMSTADIQTMKSFLSLFALAKSSSKASWKALVIIEHARIRSGTYHRHTVGY